MFFRLAHLQIGQDIALQYSHDHSNIRGTTSNAESISFGPTQRQDTTSNIMNPDVKASGGESSVINSIFSLTEPEVDGGVLDIHEGQHLEVVARGNSCTEDTDLVEPAGEEPWRMEQGRLAPAVETARVEADGSLVQDEPPGESLAAESIEQAGQDRIDKELMDRDRVMAETVEVQLGKSGDPLWPGWTSEILSEGWRQNRLYWVPPSREIAFREWQQAHDFEHLRVECDNDEDKALAELKKTTTKKIRYKRLSKPRHKTKRVTKAIGQRAITKIGATTMKTKESTSIEASSSKSDKNPPPGTGWRFDVATGGEGDNNRCHWFSPMRKIEFVRWQQACEFEGLRKQFGADEIKAWAEYRKMKCGANTRVVSPHLYDVEREIAGVRKIVANRTYPSRSAMNPPGPSWKPKLVKYRGQNRYHWTSPSRCIEFTRHTAACQFEKLREKTGNDEGRAWSEYRRTFLTFVVSPHQYDQHDTRLSPTPLPKRERVTNPNSERAIKTPANVEGKQKSTSTEAGSSIALAELKKTTTIARYKRLSKSGQKTILVTKAIGQRAIKKIGAITMKSKRSTSIEASSSKSGKNPPPGTGWRFDVATGGEGDNNRCHWFSPTRNIEFRRRKQACEFEDLRKQFGADEIKAWAEYREMKRGQPTRVVSPEQYDVETHLNRATKEIALSERGKQQNRTPLPRSGQMTGRFRKPMVADQKWASSLVGLRLKVPEHWWNGCTGNTLYAGRISAINVSDHRQRYFMLEMDTGEEYPVRYDAVLRYADREHLTHSGFNLPEKPPADPNVIKSGKRKFREELGQTVSNAKKLQKKSHEADTKFPKASKKSNSKNCLELDQSFLKSKKLQKNSHMASKKLPNASIKAKSKKCPVIKSSKKRYLMDCSSKSSSHLTRNDGLNSKDIKIVCFKEKKQISFFSKQFNGRIYRVEKTLNDTIPEKTVTYVRGH